MKRFLILVALLLVPAFAAGQPVPALAGSAPLSAGQPVTPVTEAPANVSGSSSDDNKKEARKERRSHRKAVQHRARRRG